MLKPYKTFRGMTMRKTFALLLVLCLAFSLVGCGILNGASTGDGSNATDDTSGTAQVESEQPAALFEENGYTISMEENVAYAYRTICHENTDLFTIGEVTVSDYHIISGDDTYTATEGYEWRIATYAFTYTDDNAWNYGNRGRCAVTDYYVGGLAHTTKDDERPLLVYYNGEEYYCTVESTVLRAEWENRVCYVTLEIAIQVPIGYDGIVLTFFNGVHGSENEDTYLTEAATLQDIVDEDTLFFRMD